MFLFDAIRMVTLGVQLPKTFARDVEDGGVSVKALF
jgi:MATE family multidrug resistance protein